MTTDYFNNKTILQELQESLEKEERRLVVELSSIARPSTEVKGEWNVTFPSFETEENSSHVQQEEEADEVEEYEMRLATEKSLESRLLEIKRALERLRTGAYGVCPKCHGAISLERLRANPAAEFHAEHL